MTKDAVTGMDDTDTWEGEGGLVLTECPDCGRLVLVGHECPGREQAYRLCLKQSDFLGSNPSRGT